MWGKIHEEWRAREFSTLRDAVSTIEGLGRDRVNALDNLLFPTRAEPQRTPADVLLGTFASISPDDEPLLALYIYGLCLEKWEASEGYGPIETALDALRAVPTRSKNGSVPAELFRIVKEQAQHLKPAMGVEKAMNCACPVAMAARAGEIGPILEKQLEEERNVRDGPDAGLRKVVRADAEIGLKYFGVIAKIADAVQAFVESDQPGSVVFNGVLGELDEDDLATALDGDVYASELRPHRAALKRLAAPANEHRLVIDAELIYLYPFTLEEEIDFDALLKKGVSLPWPDEGDRLHLPARTLERNDLWEHPDGSGPRYSGASVKLPDVDVTTAAGLAREFTAEVRLSRLGNHHVRVKSELKDARVTELNQALRRGTPAMGGEALEWKGRPAECGKFATYAANVIFEIGKSLSAKPVIDPSARFHVVVAANSISVLKPGTGLRPATPEQLGVTDGTPPAGSEEPKQTVVGTSLLFNPIRHLATSLEEWVRYPAPAVTNVLAGQGYAGDLVVRTENTTVSYLPTSPAWLAEEYQEMIEFVASIPPLLKLWATQAERNTVKLDRILHRIEEKIDNDLDPIEELFEQEKNIRLRESNIRRDLAVLHSPELCRTSGHRRFINSVWNAAELPTLEDELDRRLTLLAERQQRIAQLVSSIDQRNRRKQQAHAEHLAEKLEEAEKKRAKELEEAEKKRAEEEERRTKLLQAPIDILIILFGVASLAELLSWFNAVWGEEPGGIRGRQAALWEGGALLLVAIVATTYAIYRYLRSNQ